jgi:hypothetical protein
MSRLLRKCSLRCPLFSIAYGTLCVSNFKWHCGTLYFPLHIVLNALDHNQLMVIKGLEKCCIADERQHTLYKGTHK